MSILTVEQEQPHGHVAGQAIGGLPGALLYGAMVQGIAGAMLGKLITCSLVKERASRRLML